MNTTEIIQSAIATIPADSKQFVDKNLAISERIQMLLDSKNWTQKDLARELNKNESEISKWLSGLHNLTLRSITKMEAAFLTDIISVPGVLDVTTAFSQNSGQVSLMASSRKKPAVRPSLEKGKGEEKEISGEEYSAMAA